MATQFSVKNNGTILLDGAALDAANWTRGVCTGAPDAQVVSSLHVFASLGISTSLRHLVIGIIGPREATESQLEAAEKIGSILGSLGLTLICGGGSGVMKAASKGCAESDGLMIGMLPGSLPQEANPFVTVPLPTGLGEARNMVIAKSARVLIAVGNSFGTLSEIAYGLHFSKPVIGLEGAPEVEGINYASTADEAIQLALDALLNSAVSVDSGNSA